MLPLQSNITALNMTDDLKTCALPVFSGIGRSGDAEKLKIIDYKLQVRLKLQVTMLQSQKI